MASSKNTYKMRSKVFLWQGMAAWHFIGVPKKQSTEIKKRFGDVAKGWGSLPVSVTLGKTTWTTSIFPDRKSGTYLLPLKADVRKKEGISYDNTVGFTLNIQAK